MTNYGYFQLAQHVKKEFLLSFRDLIRLNLGRNKLKEVPYNALEKLSYLEILEMSDNQIETLTPDAFKGILH